LIIYGLILENKIQIQIQILQKKTFFKNRTSSELNFSFYIIQILHHKSLEILDRKSVKIQNLRLDYGNT